MKKNTPLPQISVLYGLPFHNLNTHDLLDAIELSLKTPRSTYITPVDLFLAHAANTTAEDLKQIIFHAEKVYSESWAMSKIAQFLRIPFIPHSPPEVLYPKLLERCQENNHPIYLFGTDFDHLNLVIRKLQKRYPDLNIAGYKPHPSGNIFHWDNYSIINDINESNAHLLLTALRPEKGERWTYAHYRQLQSRLTINIGNDFFPLLGKKKPASLLKKWDSLKFLLAEALTQSKAMSSIKSQAAYEKPIDLETSHIFHKINWSGRIEQLALGHVPMPPDYTRNIVCDCSAVSFIDSAGLGQLAHMTRTCAENGKFFCILAPSEPVKNAIFTMRLQKHIPIVWTTEELEDQLKRHEESLVLIKIAENGHDYLVKPLVDLKDKSLEKIENDIMELSPSLSKYGKFVLNLEYIDFIDSNAIGAILGIKNKLNKEGKEFVIANVTGVPLKTLQVLKLSNVLVEATELEVVG